MRITDEILGVNEVTPSLIIWRKSRGDSFKDLSQINLGEENILIIIYEFCLSTITERNFQDSLKKSYTSYLQYKR